MFDELKGIFSGDSVEFKHKLKSLLVFDDFRPNKHSFLWPIKENRFDSLCTFSLH